MPQNQIQFQKGLSLSMFLDNYGTESQCEAAVEKMHWPQGYFCPNCESESYCIVWHGKVKTFQCNRCHCQATLTSGTIFHSTKLPLTTWFLCMYFLSQAKNNVSALELKRHLGLCYRSAWRLKQKLMQVMCERENGTKLCGRVEVDDAYLGGCRSGKPGRGSENKVAFITAVQTTDEGHPLRVVFAPVKSFTSVEVAAWACTSLSASATVISDGLQCFRSVVASGCLHQPQVVGLGKKSTEFECFRWVNTVLGNVKDRYQWDLPCI